MSLDESLWKPACDFGLHHRPMIEELTEAQLQPIVEALAGAPVRSFSWVVDRPQEGKKGFYGYKLIPLFRWVLPSGEEGSQRCCLKRVSPIESVHYRYLVGQGLPLCRLLGAIPLAENEEIVALEYVDPIGRESLDEAGRAWYLGVTARFNAVPIDAAYAATLADLAERIDEKHKKQEIDQEAFITRLSAIARQGTLGEDFARLCQGRGQIAEALSMLAASARRCVEALPLVLSNKELDVGLQPGTGERRCFDMHSTCLLPQFLDLKQSLGLPAGVQDGWGDAWPERERWAGIYADAFNQSAQVPIAPSAVLRGARIHWIQHALEPAWKNWFLDRCLAGETGAGEHLLSVMRWLFACVDGANDGRSSLGLA